MLTGCPQCRRPFDCQVQGPWVGFGRATCVLPRNHDGPHRAHESWGEVTWWADPQ